LAHLEDWDEQDARRWRRSAGREPFAAAVLNRIGLVLQQDSQLLQRAALEAGAVGRLERILPRGRDCGRSAVQRCCGREDGSASAEVREDRRLRQRWGKG
jgi:hypothetical protein